MGPIPSYLQKVMQGEIEPPPITALVGFSLTSVEPGKATVVLPVDDRHVNPFGYIHGGLICDIADAAMGAAYHSILEEDEICYTLELKVSFLRPATKTKLKAEGHVIKTGKSVGFLECDVTDEGGNLIARASSTIMKSKPASRE
jgi:uncharacterized protein (TIGR00369 family)